MGSRFTRIQKEKVLRLLESVSGEDGGLHGERCLLPIAAVSRVLNLPPVPYGQFLSSNCWLAGGSVLRWLSSAGGNTGNTDSTTGDFDFFFRSPDALDSTARAMLDHDFQLCGYVAFSRTIREYLCRATLEDRNSGIWDDAGGLAPMTRELLERLRLAYLELRSPMGDRIQLVAFFQPTARATIMAFDFSICQFAVDDRHLTFGRFAWSDLLNARLRTGDEHWYRAVRGFRRAPHTTLLRMFKYARRGFLPYVSTVLEVSYRTLKGLTVAIVAVCIGKSTTPQ